MNAFALKDCALIAIALGKRARTLKELRDHIANIELASIYYHFWGNLLEPRFEEREYNNDFAAWTRRNLHDDTLAERLAVVSPTSYANLDELRQDVVDLIDERLDESEYLYWDLATEPFEFTRSQIVVFDTYNQAEDPTQMAELIPSLSSGSIFYHFIDARRRLENREDDFRFWLGSFGDRYTTLCEQLANLDPFFTSLTELRQQLTTIFKRCCEGV